jgi:hypothetical protein
VQQEQQHLQDRQAQPEELVRQAQQDKPVQPVGQVQQAVPEVQDRLVEQGLQACRVLPE